MNWFISIIKIAGAIHPASALLVQALSELESEKLTKRIENLEDPISSLHKDVQEVSRHFYSTIKSEEFADQAYVKCNYSEEFYKKHSKALAALETSGHIHALHAVNNQYIGGIQLCDSSYIMYLCVLSEKQKKMNQLIEIIESCEVGKRIDGPELRAKIDLPLPVIRAAFMIYESKGYGLCPKTLGVVQYIAKA